MKLLDYMRKSGNALGAVFNAVFLWAVLFVISCCLYTKHTWGTVSLPQLIFFAQSGTADGIEQRLIFEIVGYCLALPIALTWLLLYAVKKYAKAKVLFCNRLFFALYLAGLWGVINYCLPLKTDEQYVLYIILFAFYLLNQWRNFSRAAVTFTLLLFLPVVFIVIRVNGCERLVMSGFDFQETDFYAREYVYVGNPELKPEKRRNVIIVFGESLEKKFVTPGVQGGVYIDDKDAVKFADFTEGYAQRWTQGALFSAFTGTHIQYLSDFFRYALFDKLKYNEKKDRILMISNYAGQDFDFLTPNIRFLGDMTAENGYQNLFVQGGGLDFSGTAKFLYEHGFKKENVYDLDAFKGTPAYERGKYWWGVNDKPVFELFKEKIAGLDKGTPFLAVMFTLDLHRGNNPFYRDDAEIREATVANINDFIAWFKKQDFYDNTTLVILADHKRMGAGVEAGGGLYNAFFNLPTHLLNGINLNRSFNQTDVFPTVLEIAGFDLPRRKAGMGTSLFGTDKTLAERQTYEQQEETFSKIDRFYQKLWQKEKMFPSPFSNGLSLLKVPLREKLIAHAGGKVKGERYLNTLEAITASVERGYKYIELDLLKTADDRIVAAHDWFRLAELAGASPNQGLSKLDLSSISSLYTGGGIHTFLADMDILAFFAKHPGVYLVTDKIDDFGLLAKMFAPVKNRMVVEVFSPEKYSQAEKEGFPYIAYNIQNNKDFELVLEKGYRLVTMNLEFARTHAENVRKIREKGVQTMLYSAGNIAETKKNADIGDIFYYDGEENLNR